MNVLTPTQEQLQGLALMRMAVERHQMLHGVAPAWAYGSEGYFALMIPDWDDAKPYQTLLVVAGVIVYLQKRLDGVAVVTVARGEGAIKGSYDGNPPWQ